VASFTLLSLYPLRIAPGNRPHSRSGRCGGAGFEPDLAVCGAMPTELPMSDAFDAGRRKELPDKALWSPLGQSRAGSRMPQGQISVRPPLCVRGDDL
jgi:hypothetical protein